MSKGKNLDVFKPEEAVDVLTKSTGIEDEKSATMLAAKLRYLPLALEQAVAYLVKSKITYEEYIELFEKTKQEIFHEANADNYPLAVTLKISLKKIGRESAKQLLYLCSFFAPENIDRDIFIEGNEYLPEPLASEVVSESKYKNILAELVGYAFIKSENNGLNIDRLLQEAIRQSLNKVEKEEWLGYCLIVMGELLRVDYDEQVAGEKASSFVRHVISVAKYSDELGIDLKKVAGLYNECAVCLYDNMEAYEEAESLLKRALELKEEVLGAKHPDCADTLNNLAFLYKEQERYVEAEELYKRVLWIRKKALGAKHPETASTLNNLARLYKKQGKYEEAEPLYKRVLEIKTEVLGAKHPETATILNNLAVLYCNQEKYEEAEPLFKGALEIREEVLGAKHPDTAALLDNLAWLYKEEERYGEAVPLYKRVLGVQEEALGENHPDIVSTLNNFADVCKKQGRYEEAEPLYRRALKIKEEVLGAKHVDLADILNNLAEICEGQQRYAEAESLYQRELEIRQEAQGEKYPLTALAFERLAIIYKKQDKYEEAEPLLKKALEVFEEEYGVYHRYTYPSLDSLANIYYAEGRYEEAEPLCKKIIEIDKQERGTNHPDTVIALNNLALLYYCREKYADAEPLFKKVFELREEVLGAEHPDTETSFQFLIETYHKQGKYEEAKLLYKRELEREFKLELPPELEEYRSEFEKSVKPVINIKVREGKTKIWESKFGGNPYLPLGYEYPKDVEGNPLKLLAQINFEELPDIGMFPAKGLLQFYICPYDGTYGIDWANRTTQDNFRIIYIPEVKKDEPLVDTSFNTTMEIEYGYFPIEYECALTFEVDHQSVATDDFQFEKLFGQDAYDLAYEVFDNEKETDDFYNSFAPDGHRIGGYAYFTQDDPRTRRNSYKDYEVLLLQIDSDNYNDIMWGDSGVANFFIRPEDLKNLDFSKVLYNWDCC